MHLSAATGKAITISILELLQKHNVEVTNARGQAFDKAVAMSSCRLGVEVYIKEIALKAIHTHCKSHHSSPIQSDRIFYILL